MWSIILPGVPTTTWTPFLNGIICFSIGWPPYTVSNFKFSVYFVNFLNSSVIWQASSLVGANINICVFLFFTSTFSIAGIPKAAVFFVFVCDNPIISFPFIISGIDFSCISVVSSYPISCNAFNNFSDKFNSLNFIFSPLLYFFIMIIG